MPQQRFTGNRRPLNIAQQAQPPLVALVPQTIDGATVIFTCGQQLQFADLPNMQDPSTGCVLTGATQDAFFRLITTWDPPPVEDTTFVMVAYDNNTRTAQGGYIAPGEWNYPWFEILGAASQATPAQAQLAELHKQALEAAAAAPSPVQLDQSIEENLSARGGAGGAGEQPAKSGRVTKSEMRAKGQALKKQKD